MSDHFYKEKLYPLQDRVLKKAGSLSTSFYLTGGTALGRHYLNHRFSDDLDLFQNWSPSFETDSVLLIDALSGEFEIEPHIKQDSFVRFFVIENDVKLKVELVNDVGFRAGEFSSSSLFTRIDSWRNILSNKVCALTRNAPKDLADILFICNKFPFSWLEIFEEVKRKDTWSNEINSSKIIFEFDASRLKEVYWTSNNNDFNRMAEDLKIIARELLHGFDNSLYGKTFQ